MSGPDIPIPLSPEVIDIIIDNLHNDKHTLSACCLTSKQWVASCRFHLFSKMTVTPHRINSLLRFLESHSPSIASLVRNLVVDDFSEWGLDHDPETGTRRPFEADKLMRIFLLLSSVGHLHIHNCYHAITPNTFSVLTNVRELVLEDIRFTSLQHTLSFVYAFPMLESLSIVGKSNWGDKSLPPSKYKTRPGQPSFSLRRLDLIDSTLSSISKWLLGLDPVPPILSLSLYVVTEVLQSSTALLRSIGSSVLTLELKFRNPFASDDVPQTIVDISNCTNLRKVHCRSVFINPNLISPESPVVQMLSQITCHSVQELIFEFRTPDGIVFDWTFLANALADPKFDRLQLVHVQADVYSTDEDKMLLERDAWQVAERSIRQGALSVFDRRGLLHFTLFKYKKGSRVQFA